MTLLFVALLLFIACSDVRSSGSKDRSDKYVLIDEIPEPSNVQQLQINKMDEIKLELDLSDSNVFNKTITNDIFVNIKHNSSTLCESRLKDIVSNNFDCAISINNFKENRKNIMILTIYSQSDVLVVYDRIMLTFYYNKKMDKMLYSQRHLSKFERNLMSITGYNREMRPELLVLFGFGTYFLFVMKPAANRQKDIRDILDILLANSTDSNNGGDDNDDNDEGRRVSIVRHRPVSNKIIGGMPFGLVLNIGLGLLLGFLLGRSGSHSSSSVIIGPPISTSPSPSAVKAEAVKAAHPRRAAGPGLLQRILAVTRPLVTKCRKFVVARIQNLPPSVSIPFFKK